MPLNTKILEVIACPICKGKLHYNNDQRVLVCKFNKLAFPIKMGIPIMLVKKAKPTHDKYDSTCEMITKPEL